MPLYEYVCRDCQRHFEALIHGSDQPKCPACQGSQLEQQFSTYSVRGSNAVATPACGAAAGSCGMGAGNCCLPSEDA